MREIRFMAWDNKYEVGSDGSVWSLDYNHTGERKQLRTYLDGDGYPYVFLNNGGKRTKKPVHRLVAELFLQKPSEKHQVNHKNGKRDDARLENLEWVTAKENVIHSYKVLGKTMDAKSRNLAKIRFSGENNPKAKIDSDSAATIRVLRKLRYSLKQIANEYNISVSQVSAIVNGRFWK